MGPPANPHWQEKKNLWANGRPIALCALRPAVCRRQPPWAAGAVRCQSGGAVPAVSEDFLHDLATDPHERDNLVDEPALGSVRADLAKILKRRMMEAGEAEPTIQPKP